MQVRGEMTKHGVEEADETKKKVKLVRKEVRPSSRSSRHHLPIIYASHSELMPFQWTGLKFLPLQEMKFATATGRSIFNAVFNPPKVNVSELYLPRRTAFVYELEDDEYGSDIPTTLRRSKLDCPPVRTTDNPNLTCN